MKALFPPDEAARLDALRQYGILDSAPEQEFDDLTHLAAQICDTPISAISLIDEERQWFKSRIGLEVPETPRDVAFCGHTILGHDLLLIPDTTFDERFADNPFVMAEPHLRFYAGVPLMTPQGYAVGTLCVLDTVPRHLDQSQQDALRKLGKQVVALLEARQDAAKFKASEMRYRRLFEAAKDGILILDAATGQIEDVNPFLCQLLCYAPSEFLGKQLWEIGTFRDIAANQDAFRTLQEKEYIRHDDLPLETKTGQIVSVEFVSNVYVSGDKKVIQCNIRDIRERKRAAEAERESQRFLQSTLDALSAHIAVLDEDGTVIAVNKAWQQFSEENKGNAASCGVGANYFQVCDQARGTRTEEASVFAQGIREIMAGRQQVFNLEYPCHSPTERRWFNGSVTRFAGTGPVRVVVAHENITQRKHVEETLRKSNEKFHQMADNISDAFWIRSPDMRELEYLSPSFARIWGRSKEVLKANPQQWADFVLAEDRERVRVAFASLMREAPSISIEYRIARPEGEVRWVHTRGFQVRDAEGELIRLTGVSSDITERKQTQDALQKAHAELETRVEERTTELATANAELQIARENSDAANAAKSEFLSRMSHELRTPLNAILGFGQMLELEDNSPQVQESLQYILKGGRHLLGLINEILDIARIEAGHIELSIEPIALEDIVPDACALVRPLADQHQIRLNEITASLALLENAYVMADRRRLSQVLLNLLANAIKFNRPQGLVEIFYEQRASQRIRIAVRDTGPGISEQDLPKLFTPFQRLEAGNSAIEGSGLGLVLAKRLVTVMGGTLEVESVVGQGSTFYIELPQATEHPVLRGDDTETTANIEQMKPTERHYTVLCIEDNLASLRLLERILQRRPEVSLLAAMQGSIGLDLARQHQPDLILLDLNLPDMTGKEALIRLRQSVSTKEIPVVIISADATPNQRERLLEAGATAYMTKPLDVRQFLETLDEILLATQAKVNAPTQPPPAAA